MNTQLRPEEPEGDTDPEGHRNRGEKRREGVCVGGSVVRESL